MNRDDAITLEQHSWNTLTPEHALDLAAEARALDGLARSEADGGFHIAARFADVTAVLDDPAHFSSSPTVVRPYRNAPPFPPLEMDPPRHDVWRSVFRELVHPSTIRKLGPEIRLDVDRHIDSFIENGEADLVEQLAEHVPVQAICRVGGIDDPAVAEDIRVLARAALNVGGRDPEAFNRHLKAFGDYVLPIVDSRRSAPREDFLTHVATVEVEGGLLDDSMIRGALFGLFAAGHHSTTSAMSSLFWNVLSRPDVVAALCAKPALIPVAVEESLRLDPPFYGFYRRVAEDTSVSGTPLHKDDSVLVNWLAANRDPAQFEAPDEFRLDRTRKPHVAFGWGIHMCIGAPLARLELKTALEQVLARLPDITLADTPKRHFGGAGATYVDAVRVQFTPGRKLTDQAHSEQAAG